MERVKYEGCVFITWHSSRICASIEPEGDWSKEGEAKGRRERDLREGKVDIWGAGEGARDRRPEEQSDPILG